MSGGEPSSIKRFPRCAARVPALSRGRDFRAKVRFDLKVYGLILQLDFYLFLKGGFGDASGTLSQMASPHV